MKFARIKIVKLYKGGIMKRLFLTLLLTLGFMSSVNATDFIAVATQGKFNENSLGVKALSDEEMSKVVGGARVHRSIIKDYGIVTNYGQKIYYTAYYAVTLGYGDSPYFNLLPHEMAVVAVTYDFRTNQPTSKPLIVNKYNPAYTRNFNFPSHVEYRIDNYSRAKDWVMDDQRGNIGKFIPNKYYK